MGKINLSKIKYKLKDHMLIGSIYDNFMLKFKYNDEKLAFNYNVMMGQKHRMLYYKSLKKKYYNLCTSERNWEKAHKNNNSDIIWICWMQGMDNAPELVKRCFESVKKAFPDKQLIVIDETNVFDYVTLPEYIIDKWKKNIIGMAQFTDLVRLELLINRGGIWIDSTVLVTDGQLIRKLEDEPLFCYSFYYFGFNPEIMELNNWLISSCTNNNILCLIRSLLHAYWKDYDRAVDYFIFQLFATMAVEFYEDEYKKMPIVSQADAHILATYIFDEFDQLKYDALKCATGVHKLSTRFDPNCMENENTFYDVIIRKGKY